MEPIEPPWQAIKEWIPDDESNPISIGSIVPGSPNEPDPDNQTPTWKAPEIHLDDGRILVLEYS